MPFQSAETRNCAINIICHKCSTLISEIQNYVECDKCNNCYHLKCEGILGQHINRASASNHFICKSCKISVTILENTNKRPAEPSPQNEPKKNKLHPQQNNGAGNSSESVQLIKIMEMLNDFRNEINLKINDIKTNQQSMSSMINLNQNSIQEIKNNQKVLLDQAEVLNDKMNDLVNDNQNIRDKIVTMQDKQTNQDFLINKLEADIDKFNQKLLEYNVIIIGIPNNADTSIINSNILYKLDTNCSIEDISNISFLHSKKYSNNNNFSQNSLNKTTPLLLKFKTYDAKSDFIMKKKQKKYLLGSECGIDEPTDKHIYIRDHVTNFKIELFKKSTIIRHKFNIKYLWMTGSSILLRKSDQSKIYAIQSVNDINKIETIFSNFNENSNYIESQSTGS